MTRVRHWNIRHGGIATGSETPTRIAAEIEACVYAAWTPDRLIKIGYTTNLDRRIRGFGSCWTDVLLVVVADMNFEKAMHARFKPYVARGAEYYYPVAEIMSWINDERAVWGVSPAA